LIGDAFEFVHHAGVFEEKGLDHLSFGQQSGVHVLKQGVAPENEFQMESNEFEFFEIFSVYESGKLVIFWTF
jgi:hypothetical protein